MMFRRVALLAFPSVLLAVALAQQPSVPASALALVPAPTVNDALHIDTNVGSFKIVPKGDSLPSGRLSFSFKGTVLISDIAKGSYLETKGKLTKEYDSHGKVVFFGEGSILLVGRFRNCEWFGQDLKFDFRGSGIVRMIAEFDSKLKTGTYKYSDEQAQPLMTTLMPLAVPEIKYGPQPAMTRQEFEDLQKKARGH